MANLADHLFRRGLERPGKVALIYGDASLTFGDLLDRTRALAGGLRADGFGRGDKLGIMVSSRPDFIVVQQAAFALGGVVTPLNVHYRAREIEHALASCELDVLVIEAALLDRLPPDLPARCPRVRRVYVLDERAGADDPLPASLLTPLPEASGTPVDAPVPLPDDALGLLLSTSATTGKAKGVMLSVGNVRSNYDETPAWLGLGERDTILCALPLYNTFGLNQCINATLMTGCTLVLLPRFEVVAVLDAIERHRATFLPAVPAMLGKILSDPSVPTRDLHSVERILVGAAPVPGPLLERVRAVMGRDVTVMQGYGLTEATAIVTLLHVETDAAGRLLKPRSVGRTLPGIRMMIADEAGRPLPPGAVGEICVAGPNVMQGYYREPGQTALAVVDGWLRTGDLGTVDADGHYAVVDRKKDVIIRGGQNVYPVDIEEVLYGDPAVAEAAVVAEPDIDLGEVPVAYVALRPGRAVTPAELIERCRSELAYYKVPRRVVLLPELPKGPTGKILRRELRPAAAAGQTVPTAPTPTPDGATMTFETLLYDLADHVATVTFNRPDVLNATDDTFYRELAAVLATVADDPDVRCVILTGAGRGFCAGADVRGMDPNRPPLSKRRRHRWILSSVLRPLVRLEKPVIAAVNGVAVGAGMNIALACDILIASETAMFSQIFARMGLVPDLGGLHLLTRVLGLNKAKELCFTARKVPAAEALALGIANEVVPAGSLMERARSLAAEIAAGPPFALSMTKTLLNLSSTTTLEGMLEYEGYAQSLAYISGENAEGALAFKEKRPPRFAAPF